MGNLAVIGGQWGDEGKGKVVDLLAGRFDIVARWQGGPNAGHTVRVDGKAIFLHQVPSGVLHAGVHGVLGNGMVIDPAGLLSEIEALEAAGHRVRDRLMISNRAHVILPVHRQLDAIAEERGETEAIGTTRRGIGPAYSAKAARTGLRVVDLQDEATIVKRVQAWLDAGAAAHIRDVGQAPPDPAGLARDFAALGRELRPLVGETAAWLNGRIAGGAKVLFEGAQGAMLDVDLGTYPYVTSSNSVAAGLGPGLGLGPTRVHGIVGVFKAYATRVGRGPFPTELRDARGDAIRERGREYGTTTGRPRRCGWFDAVAARYSAMINGLDAVALTLFDVLDMFDEISVCVGYRCRGEVIRDFPAEPWLLEEAEPVFEQIAGWKSDTSAIRRIEDLPAAARRYIERLAELIGVEVALVSVGPDREQTIIGPGNYLAGVLGTEPAALPRG